MFTTVLCGGRRQGWTQQHIQLVWHEFDVGLRDPCMAAKFGKSGCFCCFESLFTNYLCTIPSPFSSWWNFFKIQKSPMEFLSTTVIRNPDYGKKLHKTSYRQTLLSITSIEKKRNVRLVIAVSHTLTRPPYLQSETGNTWHHTIEMYASATKMHLVSL